MKAFEFSMPTHIVFGEGEINRIGELTQQWGKKALLLTYDEEFIRSVGFYDKVEASCNSNNVALIPYFGVKSNPTIEHAQGVIDVMKKERPDVIIALGGGSVIDAAKCISVGACYDGDVWDFYSGKAEPKAAVPIIAIVTIPATSSELNGTSVMSNETLQRKDDCGHELMKPKIAILDPELTYGLPLANTAYSAADIMSHLMEAYFGHNLDWAPFQERYCHGSMKTIIECMDKIMENPKDKEARAQMMWVASYAWNGFYPCGLGPFDITIHALGHSLSNFYDTPHGAAMSVTIPATMRYFMKTKTRRFADYARAVFDVTEKDDLKAAQQGLDLTVAWFKRIGTPTTLEEAGIPAGEAIPKMVPDAMTTTKKWGIDHLYTAEKIEEMFKLCT